MFEYTVIVLMAFSGSRWVPVSSYDNTPQDMQICQADAKSLTKKTGTIYTCSRKGNV